MSDDMASSWMACMRRGDFEAAWRLSDEGRRPIDEREWTKPRHEQRIWNGAPVAGKHVLVRCYHGLGDTIQFVRFVPQLAQLAREVTLWVQPALIPLVAGVPGIQRVLPLHDGTPAVGYDVDVEIMELPYILRTTVTSLPAQVPYLGLPADHLGAGARRPGAARRRIAIAWRSGDWDAARSMPVEMAARMLDGCDVEVDVLLPHLSAGEERFFPKPPERNGIVHAAQRIRDADLVITVDTVFAHLAGALARPVWVLLSALPDWRWMDEREDSPWYPTARLFRQSAAGNWASVVDRVRIELMRTR